MKTLCERYGTEKAQKMVEKEIGKLMSWAKKHGMHMGVAMIDAGGKDVPGSEDQSSRTYGPCEGAGLACVMEILDRVLYYVPPDKFVGVMNHLRAFLDHQEQDYWQKVESGEIG